MTFALHSQSHFVDSSSPSYFNFDVN